MPPEKSPLSGDGGATTVERGRRATDPGRLPVVVLVAYVLALLAWVALYARLLPMPGMGEAMRLTDPGVPEAMALTNGAIGVGLYLLMWGTMMVAMMFPGSAPTFQRYADALAGSRPGRRTLGVVTFAGTYALLWTATGTVPLAVNAVVPFVAVAADQGPLLLGGALLVLSAYQFSPFKRNCLHHCRTALSGGRRTEIAHQGALPLAWRVTRSDVGSCWALMGLMVVVGSMNVLWMAVVTVGLSLERLAPDGLLVARAIGVLAGVAGVALLWQGLA